MVESLVITLREGIEAALVIGIILAYLRKVDRLPMMRSVYAGLACAIAASILAGGVFVALNLDPENEYLEGAMLGAAGVFVATMVVWMWRTARGLKQQMEAKLSGLVRPGEVKKGSFGLGLFAFVMVFREGIETVLFLFAATLGEFNLLGLTGALAGLALAVLFGVLLVKGSVRINLARFFSVTSFILMLLALRLILGSVHEFAEVGVLPMSRDVMSFIGFFVRDSSTMLIMMALLAAPVFMIFWDATGKTRGLSAQSIADMAAPEKRKRLAAARRERTWRISLVSASALIILAMGSTAFAGAKSIDPVPVAVTASGDVVAIPVSSLPEGQLQKFSYATEGVEVRFLAMRHTDGSVHVGTDACQICGSVGYMQEGEYAICKNCNAPILATTLGEGGGCNPLALDNEVRGDVLAIPVKALAGARAAFAK